MARIKNYAAFLLIITADFYLLPLLMKDTSTAMILLLIVMPAICLTCSIVYSLKHPFDFVFPIAVMILFLPSIFIFYNVTAWFYGICYGIVALIGNAMGILLKKQK